MEIEDLKLYIVFGQSSSQTVRSTSNPLYMGCSVGRTAEQAIRNTKPNKFQRENFPTLTALEIKVEGYDIVVKSSK